MNLDNKRGLFLQKSVIYIIIIIIFFAIFFAWVSSVGKGVRNYEKIYAKKIALIIDSAKPNTNVSVDVSKLYEIADKNKVERMSVVKIDNDNNIVSVRASEADAYTYKFFSDNDIVWNLDRKSGKLFLGVVEKNVA